MAPTWDVQMQERFDTLERKVDALEIRFDTLEVRFDTLEVRFDTLEVRFDTLETKVGDLAADMDKRFEAVDQRFDDLEERLNRRIDLRSEELRDLVQRSAEGYSATLEAITGRLASIETNMQRQHTDVVRILANHEERLTALEKPRRRRRPH